MTEKLPYDEEIIGAEEYIPEEIAKYIRRAEVEREPAVNEAEEPRRGVFVLGAVAIGIASATAGLATRRYMFSRAA